MNASTYRFTLDLHKSQSQASVSVFKNDSAVRLCMSLSDGANRYRIEDGCTAILYGNKPNGKPFVHSCVIEDNYQIVYEFTKTTASVVGIVNAQLRLYKGAEPERDEKGNIVYVGGDPIYETDADGNPKKDDNGNPIHQKDANGRLMYTDISIKFKNDHKLLTAPKFIIVVSESVPQYCDVDLEEEGLSKGDYTAFEEILLSEKIRQEAFLKREKQIKTLEDTMPLILQIAPEFNKTYADIKSNYEDADFDYSTDEVYSLWYVPGESKNFNRTPKVGDVFTATGTSNDKYAFMFQGEIVAKKINVYHFKFTDLVQLYDGGETVPLVVNATVELPVDHTRIVEGYTNSIALSALNRPPRKGDLFWSIFTTTDGYIFGVSGEITEASEDLADVYANFKLVDVVQLYDGGETVPLVINAPIQLPTTNAEFTNGTYTNSIALSVLNRKPRKDDVFWSVFKTSDGYVYGVSGKITEEGEGTFADGYANFEIVRSILLYDGGANLNAFKESVNGTLAEHSNELSDHEERLGEVEKFFEVDGETLNAARDTLIEIQKELDSDDKGAEAMAASIEKNRTDIEKKVDSYKTFLTPDDFAGVDGGVYALQPNGDKIVDIPLGYSQRAVPGTFVMRADNGNIILPSDMSLINNAFYAVPKKYVDYRYDGLKNSKLDNAGLEKKVLLENEGKQLFALLNKSAADLGLEMVPGIPYTTWSPDGFYVCYEDKAENGVTDVAASLSPDGFVRNFKDINGDTWQLKLTESGFTLSKIRAVEDGSIGIEDFSELEFPEWSEGKKTIATEQYVDELVEQNITGSSEVIPDTVVKRDDTGDVLVPLLPKSAASAASRHYTDGIYDSLEKRIENLEHDTLIYFEDSTAAYEKVVPEGYKPNAILTSIGGSSVKCNNKIPFPYKESDKTTGGITYTIQNDGGIRRTGTATSTTSIILSTDIQFEDGKTYSKSPNDLQVAYKKADGSTGYVTPTFTWSAEYTLIQVYLQTNTGASVDEIVYPMLNEGGTKKPYESFYSGFKYAETERIDIIDKNLLPSAVYDINNWKVMPNNAANKYFEFNIETEGIYLLSGKVADSIGMYFYLQRSVDGRSYSSTDSALLADGTPTLGYLFANGANIVPMYFEHKKGYKWRLWLSNASQELLDKVSELQIERGELGGKQTEYEPYSSYSIEMPEAVKALEGYGKGINKNFYNYISVENGKVLFHKVIEDLEIKNAVWKTNGDFSSPLNLFVTKVDTDTTKYISRNILTDKFDSVRIDSNSQNIGIDCYPSNAHGGFVIAIRPNNVTSFTQVTFNEYMAEHPFTAYVALQKPIVTDITHLFPKGFNIFKTVPNGAWRFVNEHKLDVPNAILYVNRKE